MKEKIFNSLKQTYSSKYGVGDSVYQGIAEALASTGFVTDENLAAVVAAQGSHLKTLQSERDRMTTEKNNLTKELEEAKKKITDPKPVDPAPLTAEAIAKIVTDAQAPLKDQIAKLQSDKAAEVRSAEILEAARKYNIPDSFVSKFNIPADANLDDYFKGVQQEFKNIGYEGNQKPEGAEASAKEEDAIANVITAGTKTIVEQNKN